jgi:hypothetical protein
MLYIVLLILLAVVGVATFVKLNKRKGDRTEKVEAATPQDAQPRSYDDLYGTHQDHSYLSQERPGQRPPGP